MALRNQPYLPLYVQDFMSDEKLRECQPESVGVFIFMMCVMHKSEEYGVILLKQNGEQISSTCYNFACKLAKHLPYATDVIERALCDLLENGVIAIEDGKMLQKRMVRDNYISEVRALAGKKGGDKTHFANKFAKAKAQANSEYENEYENKIEIDIVSDTGDINKGDTRGERTNYQEVVDLWNETVKDLAKVTRLSDGRKKVIKTRLKDGGIEQMRIVFNKVQESDYLNGRTGNSWQATFDWVLKAENWVKVIDGNYDNKEQASAGRRILDL